ncbi:hypothetical protein KL918_001028 [Ogataea parapolymorpha]|uniref:Palmitoyltransferase n=1 Tax=Ogataea parapolymorpha (strain ATCC 26012 / BCRC 20466 / JCM 22074 / NRRL Y-7560 / DL-1) TaxID=871575 RepID=W1Q9A6_OGAPD|nr:hypothetical protein HPODL_01514 [Ogataea parapolymorpha DL-1]ESW97415.1 hypothetical protein HPODL_01514 [Ogataea parapolymorpha DL-1]KAG7869483.1 hypothetical protein KL918_001028 [Ogataea parapolymorpha]KAG7875464.1 hypothetical protein KL916_000135 [Ogataea parapolymorpha]
MSTPGETELDSLADVPTAKDDAMLEKSEGSEDHASVGALHEVDLSKDDEKTKLIETYMGAAQRGDLDVLTDMLDNHKVDVNDMLDDNVSALHWCAINNKLTALKYLVSKGAKVNHKGGDLDATPLQWACRYGLVYISDYLITQCGADYSVLDNQGFNCLHLAVHSSNVMMVIYILYFTDLHIDAADPKGRTALHWAAYQGDPFTVEVLVRLGANLSLVDETGFTALNWALVHPVKQILVKLLDHGSDLNHRTNDNKSSWDIAADMNCTSMLKTALRECDINPDGSKVNRRISPKVADRIIFVFPYLVVPLCLYSMTSGVILFDIFVLVVILGLQNLILQWIIVPNFSRSPNSLQKSSLFAGVFSGSAFWCVLTWLFKILPNTFFDRPLLNLVFLISACCTMATFVKAMIIDPGLIPAEQDKQKIKATIRDLIDLRKFDSRNFCLYTSIRKPLRSKFNRFKNRNVARFDHYCPWINNDVGVRNHKLFFGFCAALEISIIVYYKLAKKYFDELDVPDDLEHSCYIFDEDMCAGSYASPFVFNLTIWALFQLSWLSLLLIVQALQISKGLTSYELSNMHTSAGNNFSSVPTDENNDLNNEDVELPGLRRFVCLPNFVANSKCARLIGLNQFLMVSDDLIQHKSSPATFDYGIWQNWLDFLFIKTEVEPYSWRNLFKLPIMGEANLDGRLVDYYQLFEIPSKPSTTTV